MSVQMFTRAAVGAPGPRGCQASAPPCVPRPSPRYLFLRVRHSGPHTWQTAPRNLGLPLDVSSQHRSAASCAGGRGSCLSGSGLAPSGEDPQVHDQRTEWLVPNVLLQPWSSEVCGFALGRSAFPLEGLSFQRFLRRGSTDQRSKK